MCAFAVLLKIRAVGADWRPCWFVGRRVCAVASFPIPQGLLGPGVPYLLLVCFCSACCPLFCAPALLATPMRARRLLPSPLALAPASRSAARVRARSLCWRRAAACFITVGRGGPRAAPPPRPDCLLAPPAHFTSANSLCVPYTCCLLARARMRRLQARNTTPLRPPAAAAFQTSAGGGCLDELQTGASQLPGL